MRLSQILVVFCSLCLMAVGSRGEYQEVSAVKDRGSLTGSTFFGVRLGDYSNTSLLCAPSVQEELKLSDEQWHSLELFYKRLIQKENDLDRRIRYPSLYPKENRENVRARLHEVDMTARRELTGILTSAQNKRLNEIALQWEGIFAVARFEIADRLPLGFAQFELIKGKIEEMQEQESAIRKELNEINVRIKSNIVRRNKNIDLIRRNKIAKGPSEETLRDQNAKDLKELISIQQRYSERLRKLRDGTAKKLYLALNPRQRKAFERMCGAKFDLDTLKYNGNKGRPRTGQRSSSDSSRNQ